MDRQAVQSWLDRYIRGWETYDPQVIGDLFSEDAVYRYHPYDEGDEVVRGRDAIVESWTAPEGNASSRDEPGSWDAQYEAWAVDGDRAVAVGLSRYWTDAGRTAVARVYDNVFLLRFDPEGRCAEFTEIFIKRPDPA